VTGVTQYRFLWLFRLQPEPGDGVDAATRQEDSMRLRDFPLAAAAFCIGLNIHVAPAQQKQLSDPGQQQRHDKMMQTKPGQNGKEEPSSHEPNTATPNETDIFVNGKLVVPGAPADSQTVPAKFSERNARLDEVPTMALPLGLSDAQKRDIAQSIAKGNAPVSAVSAKPADILPADTPVTALSDEVKKEAPIIGGLHFIRTRDKILFVRAPNMTVVGEISAN
jgi:hypothetical protein